MAKRNNGKQEDARRRRVSSKGHLEIICTLCEEEGRPYVQAHYEYVIVSTMIRGSYHTQGEVTIHNPEPEERILVGEPKDGSFL